MLEKMTDLLAMAEFLDGAVLIAAALLFGILMLILLKRKK